MLVSRQGAGQSHLARIIPAGGTPQETVDKLSRETLKAL
jgi:hypothetical protein